MVRLGDLELSPIDGHTFRAPWLCRLHEARDYGDRHQYCPLGLTSFGMRSRPVRCSPCPGQVNSVKHREEGSCTRRIALGAPRCCEALRLFERIRYLGCSSVGRCTTCPRRSEECGAQTLCAVVATHRLLPLGVPPCPREAAAERERPPVWTRSRVRDRCPWDGLIVGIRDGIGTYIAFKH